MVPTSCIGAWAALPTTAASALPADVSWASENKEPLGFLPVDSLGAGFCCKICKLIMYYNIVGEYRNSVAEYFEFYFIGVEFMNPVLSLFFSNNTSSYLFRHNLNYIVPC
jgi:hypothetical protein